MKRWLRFSFIILLILLTNKGFAQPLPCPPVNTSLVSAGADVTICPGACTTLTAFDTTSLKSTSSYQPDSTPYLPYAFNQGTPVIVNQDDIWSQVINIPFPFCFFGTKYTQLVIGSNGNISFDISLSGNFNNYSVFNPIPFNYDSYNNCIMGPFYDLDPRIIGTIRYNTYGIAPCRVFVVSWDSVATFPCSSPGESGCSFIGTQQIVLYETTYAIDIFDKAKTFFTGSTSSGNAVLGIQNANATLAYSFPGKNNAQWAETNKGYRFTPNGAPTKTYKWTDLLTGQVFNTNNTVNVCPPDTNRYALEVTFSSQCDSIVLRDTVQVNVQKAAVANFTYDIKYGCAEDTVVFTNLSDQNNFNIWDFGDGTGDTVVNPIHIYPTQGTYNVKLKVSNGDCKDSTLQIVNTQHPLDASFTVDHDSICQGQLVTFTNTSIYTTIQGPAKFNWYFGDGDTASGVNATHIFNRTGVYNVIMTVTDFVPCSDTFYHTVIVDTIPIISISVSDSILCEGHTILFTGTYTPIGNTGISWDLGDGNKIDNLPQVYHAYDSVGIYTVTLTGTYRICPDASFSKEVQINSVPVINLGPDTAMCPNGQPIIIGDLKNAGNPLATWKWNTGEAGAVITVRHPGIYSAEVFTGGCANSDSIEVRKDCYIDVPNSFTPDGDGVNDYFLPRQLLSKGLTAFKMSIFNRWGQNIFETTSFEGRGWDGKFNNTPQPQGVYVYLIELELLNGAHEQYQGNITLIR